MIEEMQPSPHPHSMFGGLQHAGQVIGVPQSLSSIFPHVLELQGSSPQHQLIVTLDELLEVKL